MKNKFLLLSAIGLLIFQSCSNKGKTDDSQTQTVKQALLAGKVYCYSDPPKADTCEYVPVGTDFFSEYLFIDDSNFVEILHNCCGGVGEKDWSEDFPARTYYPGKYKLNETELVLSYEPKVVIFYVASKINPKSDTTLTKEHVELEKSDVQTIKFSRINCKNSPYFIYKDKEGEVCIAKTTDTLENYINALRKENIWEKLSVKN